MAKSGPQGKTLEEYARDVGTALYKNLCIRRFPCQHVERYNKPEIEFATSSELLLPPTSVGRSQSGEACLIEPSINSCRISFRFREGDALDSVLSEGFYRFVMLQAEAFPLLRRSPIEGFHISFLVTDALLLKTDVMSIVQFFVRFVVDAPSFLRSQKLAVSAHSRACASVFLRGMMPM